ncbi:pectinesterase [Salvia divinorum]|uniref:Pectinesterase n=1 Tax=Salvia divinorum TaxID=28513 RepID=A0ABD1GLM3_SALDI
MINNTNANNKLALSALTCCQELLPLAIYNLNRSLSTDVTKDEVMSMICAAGTTLQTCIDGFEEQPREMFESVYNKLKYPIDLNRGTTKIMARSNNKSDLLKKDSEYPGCLSDGDRNLLQADSKINVDVVVAKDGSGKYKRMSDAVKNAPRFSKTSSNWSHGVGFNTWKSDTFAVYGEGFIARDIKFTNTAGAIKLQAMALCILPVQHEQLPRHPLGAHSNRQFYRECKIYGTINFIFGNAAMVIQKSSIMVRKPLRGQYNVITTQSRTDSHWQTEIVVQSSVIQESGDLTVELYWIELYCSLNCVCTLK